MPCVLQDWVVGLPMMQQTVLLTAIRGPDNIAKYGEIKLLLRWFRRCVLLSALDGKVLDNPYDPAGGSFTGPSCVIGDWQSQMDGVVSGYIKACDAIPHHARG